MLASLFSSIYDCFFLEILLQSCSSFLCDFLIEFTLQSSSVVDIFIGVDLLLNLGRAESRSLLLYSGDGLISYPIKHVNCLAPANASYRACANSFKSSHCCFVSSIFWSISFFLRIFLLDQPLPLVKNSLYTSFASR